MVCIEEARSLTLAEGFVDFTKIDTLQRKSFGLFKRASKRALKRIEGAFTQKLDKVRNPWDAGKVLSSRNVQASMTDFSDLVRNYAAYMYVAGRKSVQVEKAKHEYALKPKLPPVFDPLENWDSRVEDYLQDYNPEELAAYLDDLDDDLMSTLEVHTEDDLKSSIIAGLLAGFTGIGLLSYVEKAFDRIFETWVAALGKTVVSTVFNDGRMDEAATMEDAVAAQWSAVLDPKVCIGCQSLDEQVIHLTNPDYDKYIPGSIHQDLFGWHENSLCRCIWVYTFKMPDEPLIEETWVGLPDLSFTKDEELDEMLMLEEEDKPFVKGVRDAVEK
jgi:hypothetical protein